MSKKDPIEYVMTYPAGDDAFTCSATCSVQSLPDRPRGKTYVSRRAKHLNPKLLLTKR